LDIGKSFDNQVQKPRNSEGAARDTVYSLSRPLARPLDKVRGSMKIRLAELQNLSLESGLRNFDTKPQRCGSSNNLDIGRTCSSPVVYVVRVAERFVRVNVLRALAQMK